MELTLPSRRGAVVTARRWATDRARELGVVASVIPVVELLTSELVANAVTHGGPSDVHLRVDLMDGVLTVAVRDGSDDLPVRRATGPEVPGGHGMRLVERLSSTSGVEPHRDGGKTVWFTVAASGGGPLTSAPPAG
jgi:anti-sigma regulatory factor (Ser/Thr protein kinase)